MPPEATRLWRQQSLLQEGMAGGGMSDEKAGGIREMSGMAAGMVEGMAGAMVGASSKADGMVGEKVGGMARER